MVKSDLILIKKPWTFYGRRFRFQRRNGVFFLIFAIMWIFFPIWMTVSYPNLPRPLWAIYLISCILCVGRGLIYLTVVLEVNNRDIIITHIFRNWTIPYSSIKRMRAVHEKTWQDPVRIANEYSIKLNFPGWKRSKQIRLKGWCQNRKKVSHNDLGNFILGNYRLATGKTSLFD